MKKIGIVNFLGEACVVHLGEYQSNGRPAITLMCIEDGEPMATATVNYPEVPIPEGHAAFKTWSENDGLLEILQEAGIVGKTVAMEVDSGFVTSPVFEIIKTE